jgi:hypothetical protein
LPLQNRRPTPPVVLVSLRPVQLPDQARSVSPQPCAFVGELSAAPLPARQPRPQPGVLLTPNHKPVRSQRPGERASSQRIHCGCIGDDALRCFTSPPQPCSDALAFGGKSPREPSGRVPPYRPSSAPAPNSSPGSSPSSSHSAGVAVTHPPVHPLHPSPSSYKKCVQVPPRSRACPSPRPGPRRLRHQCACQGHSLFCSLPQFAFPPITLRRCLGHRQSRFAKPISATQRGDDPRGTSEASDTSPIRIKRPISLHALAIIQQYSRVQPPSGI